MTNLFKIDGPPPTISGSLHMGHVFSYTHMDFAARFQKYLGKELIYPFCFDCNGLPTEKLAQKEEKLREPNDIIQFAVDKSLAYRKLFLDIDMQYEKDQEYHTFNDVALEVVYNAFENLKREGFAYKAERPYLYCPVAKTSVGQSEVDENGCYERTGAKVETRVGEGWFIDIMNHIPRIREAIDQIQWHPESLKHRLHRWLDDVKYDWSISRERNFGVPMPNEKDGIVFDTWFTSSLSPQISWATYANSGNDFFPDINFDTPAFDVRFQAHDIIRTWALYTIVMSLHLNNQIPWKNICISGHVLDKNGLKLSKSSGNASDPYRYIRDYGANGIRFWAAHYQLGTDAKIDENTMRGYRRLNTKMINAFRFLEMNPNEGMNQEYLDTWNIYKTEILENLHKYNFTDAFRKLNEFFWNNFCSVMIEESKKNPCSETLTQILKDVKQLYEIFFTLEV